MNTQNNPAWFDLGTSQAQGTCINPIDGITTNTEFVMSLLIQMANIRITPEQKELATNIMLEEAGKGSVTILSLVTRWDAVPALKQFADALRQATLPGAYGCFFDDAIDAAAMPVHSPK